MSALSSTLPWTESPLLVNAPMAGFAGGNLASTVSLFRGLGMIGSSGNAEALRAELLIAKSAFSSNNPLSLPKSSTDTPILPLGIGILPFISNLDTILPVIREFRPAVLWLFAAKEIQDYKTWTTALRDASPDSQIWIQTGSVSAAIEIYRSATPDVLCLQGADAGGHGFERGAGIISLLPETHDALTSEGFGNVKIVAAGGIVDGRGVAAAYALGAQGVVMGTRFLASKEVVVHPQYQAAVLEAKDGGQVTTRSKVFDELWRPSIWPEAYDGRSLRVKSFEDFKQGVSIEEIRSLHGEAVKEDDKGWKTGLQGRAAIWAGTGVGLVKEVKMAAYILDEVRRETREIFQRVAKP